MPVTTAEVAASPTAAALVPHCIPRRQPASATSTPKTALLTTPSRNVVSVMASMVSVQIQRGRHASISAETSKPPTMPIRSAKMQSSGIIRISASMRGSTRNSIGEMPKVWKRVDLLVHLHGAELRGERRAGAPAHDDRRS